MAWCGVVWCDVVWCGAVWFGVVWCCVVWCGVVWYGVVWRGVVWCGVVWCNAARCSKAWHVDNSFYSRLNFCWKTPFEIFIFHFEQNFWNVVQIDETCLRSKFPDVKKSCYFLSLPCHHLFKRIFITEHTHTYINMHS